MRKRPDPEMYLEFPESREGYLQELLANERQQTKILDEIKVGLSIFALVAVLLLASISAGWL